MNINKKFCKEFNMKKDFIIIAHRGASGYKFENSMSAFKKAVELKADVIETDIQRTKDNVLVICHNDNLFSSTNTNKIISKMNYQELKSIKLKNGESIPTVEDLLESCKGKIKFNLELKARNIEDLLIKIVKKHDLVDDVIFSDFTTKSFKKIKKFEPKAKFELLTFFPYRILQMVHPFNKLVKLGVTSINPIYRVITDGLIENAHKYGLKIFPWTVNRKKKILELKKRGIDGVITNYPDILI